MKIIDLLNKIAKGEEVPEKIKWKNNIYLYCEDDKDYRRSLPDQYFTLLYDLSIEYIQDFLELEIEILEEVEDKEYEDIKEADEVRQEEYIEFANDYEVKNDLVINRRLINALIRNQQKIIKQLENK